MVNTVGAYWYYNVAIACNAVTPSHVIIYVYLDAQTLNPVLLTLSAASSMGNTYKLKLIMQDRRLDHEIALWWMQDNPTAENSTFVHVMAWWR